MSSRLSLATPFYRGKGIRYRSKISPELVPERVPPRRGRRERHVHGGGGGGGRLSDWDCESDAATERTLKVTFPKTMVTFPSFPKSLL